MNFSTRHGLIGFSAAGAVLCVFCLCGCAGATRLPTRTKGPAGANLEKHLDLGFLEESGTHEQEVRQRLSSIDTGYANPSLFWGRWSDSKWGYWWFVAAQTGAAGDAKRVWHAHNLLVRFDENGVLKEKKLIDDDSALWRELHAQLAKAPPLELTQPVEIAGKGWCCGVLEMTLTRESIRITARRKNAIVEVSPLKIVRITHNGAPNKGSSVSTTCHTLHMAEKTAIGKRIRFCADAPGVATVFQYLQQSASGNLEWE